MKIALISDIHEDIVSLKKAFKLIEAEKCDAVYCFGDILGYPFERGKYELSRNADECIQIIKMNCSTVVLGNHDLFHLAKLPEYSHGFKFPKNWYDLKPDEKRELSKNLVWSYIDDYPVKISENNLNYMNSLPEFELKEIAGQRILFSHFVYPNFCGYISSYKGDGKKLLKHYDFMDKNNCEISICGHMHIEGLGVSYKPGGNIIFDLFKGFLYYSFGEKKIKEKQCTVTIPAIADNGQVNGFAVYDIKNSTFSAISLNTNRRFIL